MEQIFGRDPSMLPFLKQVYLPSSYDALPPLTLPSPSEIDLVQDIKSSLVRKAGIPPGTYRAIDSTLHSPIENVFDGLIETLLAGLSGIDPFDLCIRLYERNEEYLGHIFMAHFDRAAKRELYSSPESSALTRKLWEGLSPYTESIRWLIEMVIKFGTTGGQRATARELHHLMELARAIYEWDLEWEQIYRGVIPHEIVVDSGSRIVSELTPRAIRINEAYQRALQSTTNDWEEHEFHRFQTRKKPPSAEETLGEIRSMGLDCPFSLERGYSLSDWCNFSMGLLDSFAHNEYRRVVKLGWLESFLSRKWNLDPQRLPALLRDFALSKETVEGLDIRQLRPVEHGRRDSRLLRRPVVVMERVGSVQCVYGVETIQLGQLMVLERLGYGRIDLIRRSTNKDIRRAAGRLQKEVGEVFERNIADELKSRGYRCQREKGRINNVRIPQGGHFGPVDVFIVDYRHQRFVLAEVKNVWDEGMNPKEMANEKKDFICYMGKLEAQVEWFTRYVRELESEYVVPAGEDYSVEGVIVVNRPRPWMFTFDDAVPILDYLIFFERLARGDDFLIHPVVPM